MWYEQPTPLMDVAPKPPPKDWHSGATAAMAKCSCTIGDCDEPEPCRVHAHMHKHALVSHGHVIALDHPRARCSLSVCLSLSLRFHSLSPQPLPPSCPQSNLRRRQQEIKSPTLTLEDGRDRSACRHGQQAEPEQMTVHPLHACSTPRCRTHQTQYPRMHACLCVCACVCACMHVCMRMCACVCALAVARL